MSTVHLTFDNGPDPEVTPHVLDVLDRYRARATFFLVGKNLTDEAGVATAELIRNRGHRIGNHSFTHGTPLGDDPGEAAVTRELAQTQALLDRVWTGPRWFRPFGGGGEIGPHLLSEESVAWLQAHEVTCVLWNSVPGDWKDPEGWVERALEDAERLDEMVVVLHDVLPGAMARLDRFLAQLVEAGHGFTNDFPLSCLPIVAGKPQPGLDAYVRSSSKSRRKAGS